MVKPVEDPSVSESPSVPHPFKFLRGSPALALAGFSLMRSEYYFGVVIVLLGFLGSLYEIVHDEFYITRSVRPQIASFAIWVCLLDCFLIGVVGERPPLSVFAYPRLERIGEVTKGIEWNQHFAGIRIVVMNNTDDDYQGLNITLRPNALTHTAFILDNDSGCSLKPINDSSDISVAMGLPAGDMIINLTNPGDGSVDVHDSSGNIYTTITHTLGYRLICQNFPAHTSVSIQLALVTLNAEIKRGLTNQMPRRKPKRGEKRYTSLEIAGIKAIPDMFGPQPSPDMLILSEQFVKGPRTYRTNRVIKISNQ